MRILLIEDEPKIASFVCHGLRVAGMVVDHLDNGVDGLNSVLQAQHDLVVLDIMLPGMDGFELLRKVRSLSIATPVIVLSAKTDLPDRLQGFELDWFLDCVYSLFHCLVGCLFGLNKLIICCRLL